MSGEDLSVALSSSAEGVGLRVKVVPGASRSRVVGLLGDRLKVSVSSPAEAGRANRAVCELIAQVLGVSKREVTITSGQTKPTKTLQVIGVTLCDATERLGRASAR